MSHSACSMALIAESGTAPPRKNGCRYISCQRCWIRAGSSPTTYSRYSSTAAATARGWAGRLPSPTPLTPSSVSTTTNSQFRGPMSTTSGSSDVIFIEGRTLRCARAGPRHLDHAARVRVPGERLLVHLDARTRHVEEIAPLAAEGRLGDAPGRQRHGRELLTVGAEAAEDVASELAQPEVSLVVGDDTVGGRVVRTPVDQQPLRFQLSVRCDARDVDAFGSALMTCGLDGVEEAAIRAERGPVGDEIAGVDGAAAQIDVVAVVRSERLLGRPAEGARPDPALGVQGRVIEADVVPIAVDPVDSRRRHAPVVVQRHVMEP